jgi:hypothetical protein
MNIKNEDSTLDKVVKEVRPSAHIPYFIHSHCIDTLYPVLRVVALRLSARHNCSFATCSEENSTFFLCVLRSGLLPITRTEIIQHLC